MRSPFKFLDSYGADDAAVFFGRTAEVEALYKLTFEAGLILLYGASGTGKTSVISCGLANRFDASDWLAVSVRRRSDLNASLVEAIQAYAKTPIEPDGPLADMVQSLYLDYFRPVYLIFDQFEELFILGSDDERATFIGDLAALLASNVNCKVILSIREEYIALLQSFEREIPTLFDHRLRIEAMGEHRVQQIVVKMCAAYDIGLEHGEATAANIVARLGTGRSIQLTYLQVYLDRLWRKAGEAGQPITFNDMLVQDTGQMADIMGQFLDEQIASIQYAIRAPEIEPLAVRHLLEEFATLEGTKEPLSPQDLYARRPEATDWLDRCLTLLEQSRILRELDGLYELAHDSLAGQIAERRSDDRKAILRIEKIVRDRLFAFQQTGTYLNEGEVAFVNRARDSVRFTAAERAFLEASADQIHVNATMRQIEKHRREKELKENQLFRKAKKWSRTLQYFIFGISIFLLLLTTWRENYFDCTLYDIFYAITADRAKDERIVQLVFTEDSIGAKGFDSVNRGDLATLLQNIDHMGAKKIGVRILIDEPRDEDPRLAEVLKAMRTPTYFAKSSEHYIDPWRQNYLTSFFSKLGDQIRTASSDIETDSDDIVRRWPSSYTRPMAVDSSTRHMALELASSKIDPKGAIAFRSPLFADLPVFTSLPIDLFLNKTFEKIMVPEIREKIVIIGIDVRDRDRFVTANRFQMDRPISSNVPGVEVLAHMTAQALDQYWARPLPDWAPLLLKCLMIVAGACTALVAAGGWRLSLGFLQISGIVLVPFALQRASYDTLDVPLASMIFIWIFSFILMRTFNGHRRRETV